MDRSQFLLFSSATTTPGHSPATKGDKKLKKSIIGVLATALFWLLSAADPSAQEYYEATVPDTLDLADKAELALNGLLGTLDPDLGYENYFNAWLDVHPAYQTHEHPGGLATINCKYAEAIPQMLVMCGSRKFLEPSRKMIQAMVDRIDDDGLFYAYPGPKRPWHGLRGSVGLGPGHPDARKRMIAQDVPYASLSGQGRFLLAMMQWYQFDRNPAWKDRIGKMIRGLERWAVHKDDYAYFADAGVGESYFGEFYPKSGPRHAEEPKDEVSGSGENSTLIWIAPQMRACALWYIMSGDEEALRFARELKNFMLKPKMWKDMDHARWQGHWHGGMTVYQALLDYAIAVNDYALKLFVREGYENYRGAGYPCIGWFDAQGCAPGRMIALAIKLCDAGVGDYWDDVEQYIRNMGVEVQVRRPELIKEISQAGPEHKPEPGFEEWGDQVIDKCVGAHWGNCNPDGGTDDLIVSGCCTGNPGYFCAWEATVRFSPADRTARINLLLNRASPWLDIDSYLPYEGKVVVKNKSAKTVFLRAPGWADKKAVRCFVDQAPVAPVWNENYLLFDRLNSQAVITVTFPMVEWTKKIGKLTFSMKGNTCIDISPRGDYKYPMFVRDNYRNNTAPMKKATRYVALVTL